MTVTVATGLVFGGIGVVNPVLPFFVVRDLGGAADTVGLVVGWYALATLVVRPFCGLWVDRSGHRTVFVVGAFGCAAGGALYPLARNIAWLFADRVLVGAALALVLAASPLWTVAVVPVERGRWALGLVGVVSSTALASSAPVGEIAYRAGGHGVVAALAAALPAGGALLVARMRPGPRTDRPARPAGGWKAVLTPALLPGISLMLTNFGYVAILAFAVVALESRGVQGGSLVLSTYALAFLVVRVMTRSWAERLGVPRTLALSCLLEVSGLVLLAVAPSLLAAAAGAVLVGAGSAHMYPSLGTGVLAAARKTGRQAGIAIYASFIQLGMAVAGPVLGLVVRWGGYSIMYVVAAAAAIAGICPHQIWRRPVRRTL